MLFIQGIRKEMLKVSDITHNRLHGNSLYSKCLHPIALISEQAMLSVIVPLQALLNKDTSHREVKHQCYLKFSPKLPAA